jgi:hypothetical protein
MGLDTMYIARYKAIYRLTKKYLQSPKELNNLNNVYLSKLECLFSIISIYC